MTGNQVYEARLLLGWSLQVLSQKTGLARSCLRKIEAMKYEVVSCQPRTKLAIVETFRDEKIEFVNAGGVHWIQIIQDEYA